LRTQDLAPLRNQFAILSVARDEEAATHLAQDVRKFGYHESASSPAAGSISLAMSEPPHILLIDYDAPTEIEDYLTAMQDASPETLVILLIRAEQSLLAFELVGKGLAYDAVVQPLVSPLELSQTIDRAASELYHLFETEQLREYLTGKGPGSARANPAQGNTNSNDFDELSLNEFIAQLGNTRGLDETIQVFIDSLSREWKETPVLYFKYLPSHASLPLALAAGKKIDQYRGFGVDLKRETPEQIIEFFRAPESSLLLKTFVKDVFSAHDYTAFTHTTEGEALGLFVALTKHSEEIWNLRSRVLALKRIFDLSYKKNVTLKEKHALDFLDSLTGVSNRRSFTQKLEDEVSRARRILMPLSLITVDLDNFHKVNEKVGFQQADAVLKAVAAILKKTTRVSDVIARTGPDEFTLLLPHTGQTGAAIKAERLRRLIESTKFPLLGHGAGHVTVSAGVSEYPSLCQDGEGLVRSADEALSQVRESQNKVCLAAAPQDFQMDFTPNEVKAEDSIKVKR
jgi:diguanylate cyclase (GGDEF)-like protein